MENISRFKLKWHKYLCLQEKYFSSDTLPLPFLLWAFRSMLAGKYIPRFSFANVKLGLFSIYAAMHFFEKSVFECFERWLHSNSDMTHYFACQSGEIFSLLGVGVGAPGLLHLRNVGAYSILHMINALSFSWSYCKMALNWFVAQSRLTVGFLRDGAQQYYNMITCYCNSWGSAGCVFSNKLDRYGCRPWGG